jgi:hypothetical protein
MDIAASTPVILTHHRLTECCSLSAARRHKRADFARPRLDNSIGSNGVSDADSSLPPSGQTLSQAVKSLVATFDARSIGYAIIGGIATTMF